MAAFYDEYSEELTYNFMRGNAADLIRVSAKSSAVKSIKSQRNESSKSNIIFSELVTLYDPTVRFKKKKEYVLVLTEENLFLLDPLPPFECSKRAPEGVPVSWVSKIYADRIGSQVMLKIPADYDMWLEVPAKTQFLHIFSQLHKLFLQENPEGRQIDLQIAFVFNLGSQREAKYVDAKIASKTKSYKDAKDRVHLLLREAKKAQGIAMSKKKVQMSPSKKKALQKKKLKVQKDLLKKKQQRAEKKALPATSLHAKIPRHPRDKALPSDHPKKAALHSEGAQMISLIGKDKVLFLKELERTVRRYDAAIAQHAGQRFENFQQKIFYSSEFKFKARTVTLSSNETFFPNVYCDTTRSFMSVRKILNIPGVISNEQKPLIELKGHLGVMENLGTFEETHRPKRNTGGGGNRSNSGVTKRYKYYLMNPVDSNYTQLLENSPIKFGLPVNEVAVRMGDLLLLLQSCHNNNYFLGAICLNDMYVKNDPANKKGFGNLKFFQFNKFKKMKPADMRHLEFEEICSCPKALIAQTLGSYTIERLQTTKEMDFWSYGILLFKMLTGKYPFPDLGEKFSLQLFYDILNGGSFDINEKINSSGIADQSAKFLLKKLLVQDQKNISMTDLLNNSFFSHSTAIQKHRHSVGEI